MTPRASPATLVTTPSDREIVITRVVSAPRSLVFEVYTGPAHLPNWMLGPDGWSMPICEIDLRVGGAWRFVWRRADGAELEMRGIYREIAPPERLVFINSFSDADGGLTRAPFPQLQGKWPLEVLNTLTLTEQGGKTALTLRGRPINATQEEIAMYVGMFDSMRQGFGGTFDQLAEHLAKATRN